MAKTNYYVFKLNGEVRRLAKIEDGINAYAFVNGEWIPKQSLIKIENEITDYDSISEDEANKLIKEGNLKEVTR